MIKKSLSILAVSALLLTTSCKKESTDNSVEGISKVDPNGKFATMDFDKSEHDFGDIMQGDKVETEFTFTNNGEADLVITSAKGSCGCTVPEYPKEPVAPGEKASLKVSFNSSGKKGRNKKSITIQANTASGVEKLTITADIAIDPNKKVERKELNKQPVQPVTNKQTLK